MGATGTGKELIARCLHAQSARSAAPFVPVDCATISGPLCASQLFGHVKGAFTGADYAALGCFRAAEGGTIFLDEVGELDQHYQSMLLRVIQQRTVVPVGSHRELPVDVRIIAATNRPLDTEVHSGRFRMDLYYRLNVVSLRTLPLRDRADDIPVLARHFLDRIAEEDGLPCKRLSLEGLAKLCSHDWPGNVRELQNVLERAAVFSDTEVIGPAQLDLGRTSSETSPVTWPPPDVPPQGHSVTPTARRGDPAQPAASELAHAWLSLADCEAQHIARTLELTGYNQSAAARLLRIDRHLLARRMKKYGLRRPPGLS